MGADVCSEISDEEKAPLPSSSDSDLGVNNGRPIGGAGNHYYVAPCPDQVLENVLENVLCFLTDRRDRNAASLVCKSWYRVEAMTRSEVFIGNCYAVSPQRVTRRFGRVKSVSIKGKPRFADFSLLPPDWGAYFSRWVATMAEAYCALEKVYLKRMLVTDDDLVMLSRSFPSFKELVLVCCEGFGTSGLSVVASQCRSVRLLFLTCSLFVDLALKFLKKDRSGFSDEDILFLILLKLSLFSSKDLFVCVLNFDLTSEGLQVQCEWK